MAFTELNSVEHYTIHQLCGVNLNNNEVQEPKVAYGEQWQYKSAADLNRSVNEVLMEQNKGLHIVKRSCFLQMS